MLRTVQPQKQEAWQRQHSIKLVSFYAADYAAAEAGSMAAPTLDQARVLLCCGLCSRRSRKHGSANTRSSSCPLMLRTMQPQKQEAWKRQHTIKLVTFNAADYAAAEAGSMAAPTLDQARVL